MISLRHAAIVPAGPHNLLRHLAGPLKQPTNNLLSHVTALDVDNNLQEFEVVGNPRGEALTRIIRGVHEAEPRDYPGSGTPRAVPPIITDAESFPPVIPGGYPPGIMVEKKRKEKRLQ